MEIKLLMKVFPKIIMICFFSLSSKINLLKILDKDREIPKKIKKTMYTNGVDIVSHLGK